MSTASTCAAPNPAAARASTPEPVPTSSTRRSVMLSAARNSRASRVVTCEPEPNARPGSILTITSVGSRPRPAATRAESARRPDASLWACFAPDIEPCVGRNRVHVEGARGEHRQYARRHRRRAMPPRAAPCSPGRVPRCRRHPRPTAPRSTDRLPPAQRRLRPRASRRSTRSAGVELAHASGGPPTRGEP